MPLEASRGTAVSKKDNMTVHNSDINSGKNHETYALFSAVVEGQHLLELTTHSPPTKYYFRFISFVRYDLFLNYLYNNLTSNSKSANLSHLRGLMVMS